MSAKQLIMIAGPYRSGTASEEERIQNLKHLNQAAVQIFRKGHIPIVGVNLALPVIETAGSDCYDEMMMPLSLALAARCDAVLRMGGASLGADEEVELIRSQGGKVYKSISEIPEV